MFDQQVLEADFPKDSTDAISLVDNDCVPWEKNIVRKENIEEDMISFDYDEMYAQLNPLKDNKDKDSSVVGQIVTQLLQTMNPSKVRLPTCVLECRKRK